MKLAILLLVFTPLVQAERISANPIRKVVNMLQMMQKKVAAEGEREKALFEKFMCYCRTNGGNLEKSIGAAEKKIPEVESAIKAGESQHQRLVAEIAQAKADRSAAKKSMAEATALRENEAAAFAKVKATDEANIGALEKAIAALKQGMSASFLQTSTAQILKKLVIDQDMRDSDRQEMLAFLTNTQSNEYAPASGEIVGILEEMHETMSKGFAAATEAEATAIADYKAMMASKQKEVSTLGAAIESKTARDGEVRVRNVQMAEDLDDTQKSLMEDRKFFEDLKKNCATKEEDWEVIKKTRAEEQLALADTIRLLNDDDALELFKKTLPGSGSSLLQVDVSKDALRARALASLKNGKHLQLITMALEGKTVGFEKVIKMIDDMVALLDQEQKDDDDKKAYCNVEIDTKDDKRKALDRAISDQEGQMEDAKAAIEQLTSDIKALEEGIVALDKAVSDATSVRQSENAEYKELMSSNTAAKELIGLAKNRLNKFYNPKLYKAPPKRKLSDEDFIVHQLGGTLAPTDPPAGIAGTGITAFAEVKEHQQDSVAPPPPPETFGAYVKKDQESHGVIAMMDLLIGDLDKEMTEATADEKDAQANYEKFMRDSAEKRVNDSRSLEEKTIAKADAQANLQKRNEEHASTTKELMATLKLIQSLHNECDWLLQFFDTRKEARAGERDSLLKAKAILSGADYSFIQEGRSLRR